MPILSGRKNQPEMLKFVAICDIITDGVRIKYQRFRAQMPRIRRNAMNFILYNSHSGDGKSTSVAKILSEKLAKDSELVDITSFDGYHALFSRIAEGDEIYLLGGDGTLNHFVNDTEGIEIGNTIHYIPTGSGNDFYNDVADTAKNEPIVLNDYIKALPTVTVNGKKYRFINGVGYGIDGYCCEVGDALHAEGKNVNYTAIAIKGLLFSFKPRNAVVTVDSVTEEYKKVWIAPTMYGRHYGGGMIPTPDQKRGSDELSLMLFHGSGKLRTLMIFPSIFKGEHVRATKYVKVLRGREITVKFDKPTPLQIDGETILGVTEYTATI